MRKHSGQNGGRRRRRGKNGAQVAPLLMNVVFSFMMNTQEFY